MDRSDGPSDFPPQPNMQLPMKTSLSLLLALAGLLCWSGTVSAQEKPAAGGGRGTGEGGGGGAAGRGGEWRARMVKEFDKDGDGKLSEEEMKAARESAEKRMLEQFDADKDGKLSDEERAKAREAGGGRGGFGGGPGGASRPVPPEMLKKYDKDGDGKLNEEEAKALRDDRQKEALAKYDADKDGQLSDGERTKMREDWQKENAGRPGAGGGRRPEAPKPAEPAPAAEPKKE